MKTAIKLIALSLVLVMSVMMLASCGALSGKYEAGMDGLKITYEFSGNKIKATSEIGGATTTIEGTYEIKDDKIIVTYEEDGKSVTNESDFEKGDDYIKIDGMKFDKK